MTSAELILALAAKGYYVTPRRLTDWRAKGLLPRLDAKSRGRSKGVQRPWPNATRTVEQAIAVCIAARWKRRAEFVRLTLWFTGFDVDVEDARRRWLQNLDCDVRGLRRTIEALSDPDDFFGPMGLKIARSNQRNLKIDHQVAGMAFATLTRAFYDPSYSIKGEDAAEAVELLNSVLRNDTASPDAPHWSNSAIAGFMMTLRDKVSLAAIRNLIAEAEPGELEEARATWITFVEIISMLVQSHMGRGDWRTDKVGLRFVAAFSSAGILFMLFSLRLGFKHRIDRSFEILKSIPLSAPGELARDFLAPWSDFNAAEAYDRLRGMTAKSPELIATEKPQQTS
jgi:hypothetical protein